MRRDKVNYYLDLAEIVSQRGTCLRRRYGAVIVKMMRWYRLAMSVPQEDAKTVLILAIVFARNFRFQGASAMNCAEAFTLRQTPSSVHQEIR